MAAVRAAAVDAAKEFFTATNPEALISAIDPECPHIIYWLVQPPTDGFTSILTDPKDWTWLAPILIEAAKLAPETMALQLGYLVADFHRHTVTLTVTIRRDFVVDMFGDRTNDLLAAIALDVEPELECERESLQLLRVQARGWLADRAESPLPAAVVT